ncbi:hypothetical protein IAU59_004965 [Kwoniella sp. CBS 9459]
MAHEHPHSHAHPHPDHHRHQSDYGPGEPIEPTIAAESNMLAHAMAERGLHGGDEQGTGASSEHGHYVFRFLRQDMPLPGQTLVRIMLAVLFLVMFLAGWNDASQGPLLPSLQSYYDVNYLVISTIWLANFAGFMTSGVANVFISDAFGFGIAAPFGAAMQALAYCLICWGAPYPLFVIAYVFNGFGLGLQDAQVNSLVTRLENNTTKMFLMHAMYGFGATISPFVSTAFVQHEPRRVYLYFAASLGLALLTVASLVIVFRGRTEDQVVGRRAPDKGGDAAAGGSAGKLSRILKMPVVHAMAMYMVIYVGTEVMIGGWATSYLIDERGGNDDSGYVSSGYFGGLTIGRIVLIPVTKKLGNHTSIYVYSVLTIVLSLIIWFTKTIVGNAVCFSLIGVLLGPMYPIVMNVIVDMIPPEIQGGTIGWCASLGQAGSAILPFVTGAISEKYGVWVLQPLTVALMGASIIIWFFVTRASHTFQKMQLEQHESACSAGSGSNGAEAGDADGQEQEKARAEDEERHRDGQQIGVRPRAVETPGSGVTELEEKQFPSQT